MPFLKLAAECSNEIESYIIINTFLDFTCLKQKRNQLFDQITLDSIPPNLNFFLCVLFFSLIIDSTS